MNLEGVLLSETSLSEKAYIYKSFRLHGIFEKTKLTFPLKTTDVCTILSRV